MEFIRITVKLVTSAFCLLLCVLAI